MSYGYLHRGRVVEPDATTGGYVVEIPALAPTRRMGPFPSLEPNLPIGQRIVLASLGTSRDEMVILGRVPGTAPTIGQIPGLQAALDAKADDTEIVTISGQIVTINGQIVTINGQITSINTALGTKVNTSAVGAANGVASLDSSTKLPLSQLPSHASTHGSAGADPVTPAAIGALATTARGAASGVGSLDSGTRQPLSEVPTVVRRTVWMVQREDDAVLGTANSTTKVALHTVNLTGLTANTLYEVVVKVPAFSSVAGDEMRIGLHKTSIANNPLDQSTPEPQKAAATDVHALRVSYFYLTGAAETSVTFVVSGHRASGTGTVTFRAFLTMPYQFAVTQVGTALNSF